MLQLNKISHNKRQIGFFWSIFTDILTFVVTFVQMKILYDFYKKKLKQISLTAIELIRTITNKGKICKKDFNKWITIKTRSKRIK